MSLRLQEFIHSLEEGTAARYLRWLCAAVAMGALAVLYDTLAFRNLACPEAMETAQLARNLAEGKGYTTLCVRPFGMFLLQRHRPDHSPMLKEPHPDLVNPPAYPWLLAGVLKTGDRLLRSVGGLYTVPAKGFRIHKADVAITALNQVLLLLSAALLFAVAARLFDRPVAWGSALVFLGTEQFWRFSISGLSTNLLLVLVLGVVWCWLRLEEGCRTARNPLLLLSLAALTGALIGLGGLTRYAFGWFLVPLLVSLAAFGGPLRGRLALAATAAFLVVMAPWVARNWRVSGTPFGLATFAVMEGTRAFPDDRLERSLEPDLTQVGPTEYSRKLAANTREIFQNELPKLGGSWVAALFAVGLLSPFRNPAPSRLRWFLLAALLTLTAAQALGQTYLTKESPTINSENLLVLVAPLVLMFGVSFFFVMLESLQLPSQFFRLGATGAFVAVVSLPLFISLLPPRQSPIVYPPYYPPMLRSIGVWMNEQDLVMTDIPWAVAWYGRRQALLPPLNGQKDFFRISDYMKPIHALYLTPRTTDTRFISTWVKGDEQNWCKFLFETIARSEVPTGFPLRYAPVSFLFPEQLFLTDLERWKFKTAQP